MPLSLNEIRKRASAFSKRWENESSEDAEAKTNWGDFISFEIRTLLIQFKHAVK